MTGAAGAVPWPTAVIFDLDGTLVDSLPDMAGALNELMQAYELAPHADLAVAHMIGRGVPTLVERAFVAHGVTLDAAALQTATEAYLALYLPRATRETRLYPGAGAAVAAMAAAGRRLALCTNKPAGPAREIVDAVGIGDLLPVVIGGDHGPPRKPAPDLVIAALEALGVAADAAVMVGDSSSDVAAAKAAGVAVIAVGVGYTPVPVEALGADAVIADWSGFDAALDGLRGRRG